MSSFMQDVRFGWRALGKNPGLTAVAVIALALGIGANTVMFSTVEACVVRPFAFRDLDRAVAIWETAPKQNENHISAAPANFLDWRTWNQRGRAFDLLAATHGWNVNLTGSGVAERAEGSQVTPDFFALLGIAPQLGRSIAAGDYTPGRDSVIVLNYRFWQRRLGGDRQVVGRSLLLNGAKSTVIGVMPVDFDFPPGTDLWAPLDLAGAPGADRSSHYLKVIGRLRAGIPAAQAQADLNALAARLGQEYPATNANHGVRVIGLVEDMTVGTRQFVLTLMGAAVFVLLLACANVTNLNLARATARQKEVALRIAMGAGRWRIVRQFLVEGVLVSMAGAAGSLLLASWAQRISMRSIPPFIVQHVPGIKYQSIDWRVFAFTLVIGVGAGILAALAPALQASHADVNQLLKEGGRSGTSGAAHARLRALLVASEVALALVLLVGAGLMAKGFRRLLNSDLGFDRYHVLTFHVALAESKYRDAAGIREFYDQLVARVQALPGVQSAAAVASLPGSWNWDVTTYRGEGQPPAKPGELRTAMSQVATPDFLRALRVPLLKGRFFTSQDGPEAPPVAVINGQLAQEIWPNQDAIGKRIQLGGDKEPWRTVVGIAGDFRQSSFDTWPVSASYVPFAQVSPGSMALAIRTAGDPLALAAAARAAVAAIDPDQPPYEMRALQQIISDNDSGVEFSAKFMVAFAVIALILAAAGIFAVMAYSVRQRTHEIGVRMALGARRSDMLRMVIGYALKLVGLGLLVGLPISIALSRILSTVLFKVISMDIPVLAGLTLLLALIAALAAYVPALWASKADPMEALRYE
ncbi:MAG TPA: ABC transporter permease [Terriglobia bacterium]|nr:ABC transporter permease [Terriglobia bacterium]